MSRASFSLSRQVVTVVIGLPILFAAHGSVSLMQQAPASVAVSSIGWDAPPTPHSDGTAVLGSIGWD